MMRSPSFLHLSLLASPDLSHFYYLVYYPILVLFRIVFKYPLGPLYMVPKCIASVVTFFWPWEYIFMNFRLQAAWLPA